MVCVVTTQFCILFLPAFQLLFEAVTRLFDENVFCRKFVWKATVKEVIKNCQASNSQKSNSCFLILDNLICFRDCSRLMQWKKAEIKCLTLIYKSGNKESEIAITLEQIS